MPFQLLHDSTLPLSLMNFAKPVRGLHCSLRAFCKPLRARWRVGQETLTITLGSIPNFPLRYLSGKIDATKA